MTIEIEIVESEKIVYMAHDGSSGVKYAYDSKDTIPELVKDYIADTVLDLEEEK